MPSGTLGQADLAATTNTTVYTVPAGKTATISINVCNRGTVASSVNVRVAIASAATPTNAEYIEYDATLVTSAVLERTAIVVSAGEQIVVYSSAAGVSVNVYGFEE